MVPDLVSRHRSWWVVDVWRWSYTSSLGCITTNRLFQYAVLKSVAFSTAILLKTGIAVSLRQTNHREACHDSATCPICQFFAQGKVIGERFQVVSVPVSMPNRSLAAPLVILAPDLQPFQRQSAAGSLTVLYLALSINLVQCRLCFLAVRCLTRGMKRHPCSPWLVYAAERAWEARQKALSASSVRRAKGPTRLSALLRCRGGVFRP